MKGLTYAAIVSVLLCMAIYGAIAIHRKKVADAVYLSLKQFFHVGVSQTKLLADMRQMGPEAIPPVIDALSQTGEIGSAAEVVLLNNSNAASSLPQLLRLLANADPATRNRASLVIMDHIRAQDTFAIPVLISALDESNNYVRGEVIGALTKLGPPAKAAVPALTKALGPASPEDVRLKAALALSSIDGSENGTVIPILKEGTASSIPWNRYLAADFLYKITPDDKELIPVFISSLTNTDHNLRISAANSLRRYGPQASAAVPFLLDLLQAPNPRVNQAARRALEKIAPATLGNTNAESHSPRPSVKTD